MERVERGLQSSEYAKMAKSLRCVKSSHPVNPILSVLVRIKNERPALEEFWERLSHQTIIEQTEVIFLDSGSTDGSLEFLSSLPVTIYTIDPQEFQFGSSCNLLMSVSHAPFSAFFSGHVLFTSDNTLGDLYKELARYKYAAAFFRQVPNALWGATSYEKAYLRRRFPERDTVITVTSDVGGFSNAASGLTRESWNRLKFQEIDASEDQVWATEHMKLGGALLYLSSPPVMHSHNESPEEVFKRVRLNVKARNISGSYLKSGYYWAGVFISSLVHGASLLEAWRYACAHGRAYLR